MLCCQWSWWDDGTPKMEICWWSAIKKIYKYARLSVSSSSRLLSHSPPPPTLSKFYFCLIHSFIHSFRQGHLPLFFESKNFICSLCKVKWADISSYKLAKNNLTAKLPTFSSTRLSKNLFFPFSFFLLPKPNHNQNNNNTMPFFALYC